MPTLRRGSKPKLVVRQRMYSQVKGEPEQFCPLFASLLGELIKTTHEWEGELFYSREQRGVLGIFANRLDQYGQGKASYEALEEAYGAIRLCKNMPGWIITNCGDMLTLAMKPSGRVAAFVLNDFTHIGKLDPERTFAVVNLIFDETNVHMVPIGAEP